MVLFNHSTKDFKAQVVDRIAQLILGRIETPQVKNVATLDDIDRGAGGLGSTGLKPFVQSPPQKDKKGKKKKGSLSPIPGSQPW